MNKAFSLLAMTLLASSLTWGQSKVSPYSAHYMHSHNVVAHSADESGQVVSAYLHTTGTPDVAALERLGVKVNLRLDGILTVRLPLSAVPELEKMDFVKYIQFGTPVRPMLDSARVSAGVDRVQNGEGLSMPYTGKDVVIGIIDGGFDYTHPAFRDKDGNLRIKRVWEQCFTKGSSPEGFNYGCELNLDSIISSGGTQSDVYDNSHGTHVTNIAAGASHLVESPYYGVASDADIVLVSNRYDSGDEKVLITTNNVNISDAIAYIYDYAESVGKPCVINMSLGNHIGPHDGTSTFDQVADQLQGKGRLLVGSVGNHGATRVHVSKSFTGAEDAPLKFMIQKKDELEGTGTNISGATVEVWGEAGMSFDLNLVVLSTVGSQNKETVTTSVLTVGEGEGTTQELDLTDRSSCVGNVLVTTEVNPLNNRPHALLTFQVQRVKDRVIGIVLTPRGAGTVHAWADGTFLSFAETTHEGWTSGDTNQSLTEIGGTGKRIVSVGAYVSKNVYKTEGSNRDNTLEGETLYARGTFSSTGPTLDGRMKPDVMAPGTYVASAISSHDGSTYSTAQTVTWNENTYTYSYMQGTSMAAPFVTGVLATWLQANPNLTPEEVRDVLSRTAVGDDYTTSATCGYGKVDAYNGLKSVIALAEGVDVPEASVAEKGFRLVRQADGAWSVLFTLPQSSVDVVLYDAVGNRLQHRTLRSVSAGEECTLDLNRLPRGIYLLQVGCHKLKINN